MPKNPSLDSPMIVSYLAPTFTRRAGHPRSYAQMQQLLDLDMKNPPLAWRECVDLASAYEKDKKRSDNEITSALESIRVAFDAALMRACSAAMAKSIKSDVRIPSRLAAFAAEWEVANPNWEDREARHLKRVVNLEVLSADYKEDMAVREKVEAVEVDAAGFLAAMENSHAKNTEGIREREEEHRKRVENPSLLSTK